MESFHMAKCYSLAPHFLSNVQEIYSQHQKQGHTAPKLGAEPLGRGQYSNEVWEAQKPVIWRLYNVENKPYKQVVETLRDEYKFFPTYAFHSLDVKISSTLVSH